MNKSICRFQRRSYLAPQYLPSFGLALLIAITLIGGTMSFSSCQTNPFSNSKEEHQKAQRDSITRVLTAQWLGQNLANDSLLKPFSRTNTDYLYKNTKEIYTLTDSTLLWQDLLEQKPYKETIKSLITTLQQADIQGLQPANYHPQTLDSLLAQAYPTDSAYYDSTRLPKMLQLDLNLTAAALSYTTDLLRGRTKPGANWDMQYRNIPLAEKLLEAVKQQQIPQLIAQVCPQYPAYKQLSQYLADSAQQLPPDQADKIRLNMERFRWLPHPDSLGSRYVWVNIPEFQMYVVQNKDTASTITVVVGEPKNATPAVANKKMHNVIFSPVWNVPIDIAYEEMEYILKNPAVLIVADVDVWVSGKKVDPRDVDWANVNKHSVKMRQRPKATNSMGRVKFPFDNNYGVYIHDTPNQHDFGLKTRATSHGCVRVKEPETLAAEMLKGSKWTKEGMRKAMYSGKQQYANLPQGVSVNFVYFTAWPKANGQIQYAKDVYGYDKRQLKALVGPTPAAEKPLKNTTHKTKSK